MDHLSTSNQGRNCCESSLHSPIWPSGAVKVDTGSLTTLLAVIEWLIRLESIIWMCFGAQIGKSMNLLRLFMQQVWLSPFSRARQAGAVALTTRGGLRTNATYDFALPRFFWIFARLPARVQPLFLPSNHRFGHFFGAEYHPLLFFGLIFTAMWHIITSEHQLGSRWKFCHIVALIKSSNFH